MDFNRLIHSSSTDGEIVVANLVGGALLGFGAGFIVGALNGSTDDLNRSQLGIVTGFVGGGIGGVVGLVIGTNIVEERKKTSALKK